MRVKYLVQLRLFIGFRQEVAYAIRGDRRAKETIKLLGLNRENLSEERRDHLAQLAYLREVLDLEVELSGTAKGRLVLEEARVCLREAVLESAKFAAMTRAAANSDS